MDFQHIEATFGKLEHRSLSFSKGLNIIEAPNESGKSTLLAFLRVMLYGFPPRERGAMADKNRYAPWSLSPMRGTLALTCQKGDITLQRDTARANSPMGRFSAVYTGSGEAVDGLTAADCGETLLGVPCEVYERSAFIRGDASRNISGCVANGIPEDVAASIYNEMYDFANYAFNKAHSVCYAVIAYQTAWFKCYYPREYMAALMTSVLDSSVKISEYIAECRAMDIALLPPDINESNDNFTVVPLSLIHI